MNDRRALGPCEGQEPRARRRVGLPADGLTRRKRGFDGLRGTDQCGAAVRRNYSVRIEHLGLPGADLISVCCGLQSPAGPRASMARRCRRRGHHCNSFRRGEIAYWLVRRQQRRCIDLRGRCRAHRAAAMGILYKSDLPVRRRTGSSVCQPPRKPTRPKAEKATSACSGVMQHRGTRPGESMARRLPPPLRSTREAASLDFESSNPPTPASQSGLSYLIPTTCNPDRHRIDRAATSPPLGRRRGRL